MAIPLNPLRAIRTYARRLHTGRPAGLVERLPRVGEDGRTNVTGLFVAGDLAGPPLLKFAVDSGARAARAIVGELAREGAARGGSAGVSSARGGGDEKFDLVIVGAGPAGIAAAMEARRAGLRFVVLDAAGPFATIADFPARKPIFTYPREMTPAGELRVSADVKEALLEELRAQAAAAGIEPRVARVARVRREAGGFVVEIEHVHEAGEPAKLRARRVLIAVGRSGDFRRLGVPGEDLPKVHHRLHDPKDHAGFDCLVVGGGDSAAEAAIALAEAGARVTLCHRGAELLRPKPENARRLGELERGGRARVLLSARVVAIGEREVVVARGNGLDGHDGLYGPDGLNGPDGRPPGASIQSISSIQSIRSIPSIQSAPYTHTLPNDIVFTMIGREAPLAFLRRCGVKIAGDWTARSYATLALALLACVFLYHWKTNSTVLPIYHLFERHDWFPFGLRPDPIATLDPIVTPTPGAFHDPRTLLGTLRLSASQPGFWYSLAYCAAVVGFGVKRIRRRRTPYVRAQTLTLMAIQCVPLFLLPYFALPWLGHNGGFDAGPARAFADEFFPATRWDAHGREYWRSAGFVLAWPLFLWNVFTPRPMTGWLIVGFVQTFVLIPLMIRRWGKGAYCGWICSCGALAETMGDAHRHKAPHGPRWNRLNMLGQVLLVATFVLLALRIASWIAPGGLAHRGFAALFEGKAVNGAPLAFPWNMLNYAWAADLMLAGVLGVGLYWHFSGRSWCRFACPLAALMHVYALFSRFAIVPDKKKCISCNVCTTVCHQGIDVMSHANRGLPMQDVQCVRCSACVQACPTDVLRFGRVDAQGRVLGFDATSARAEPELRAPTHGAAGR